MFLDFLNFSSKILSLKWSKTLSPKCQGARRSRARPLTRDATPPARPGVRARPSHLWALPSHCQLHLPRGQPKPTCRPGSPSSLLFSPRFPSTPVAVRRRAHRGRATPTPGHSMSLAPSCHRGRQPHRRCHLVPYTLERSTPTVPSCHALRRRSPWKPGQGRALASWPVGWISTRGGAYPLPQAVAAYKRQCRSSRASLPLLRRPPKRCHHGAPSPELRRHRLTTLVLPLDPVEAFRAPHCPAAPLSSPEPTQRRPRRYCLAAGHHRPFFQRPHHHQSVAGES